MKSKKINRIKDMFTEDDFKPENVKANITIRMPLDLLDLYRAEAKRLGIGYQTLMQMKLRESISSKPLEDRIANLEKVISKNRKMEIMEK
jgi:uncharacterized protein (DUF4415 family)